MTRRISMTIGVVAAVLLLAVLAGLVGLLYARPVTAQTSAGVPGMRQVTVVGRGEVKGAPDTATVQIGVETEATTAKDALAQNSAEAKAVQDQLAKLGVDAKDIQTNNFSISPTYGTDGRQVTGYRVSNMVTVKIRQLDQAGTLLDQVVQAGANNIYGISFSVENPETLLDQARKAAIENAKARATQLAGASGAAIGDVLVINENVGSQPIPMPMMVRAEDMAAGQAAPVQPGEQSFSVDVQVTFGLK
ncbi:MAG TPA: SIMPL domain-containing protein [Roseiflexaceae bacterium]|nr:SIMPL domain-containing protein [Roseiflexaceae bacterium]